MNNRPFTPLWAAAHLPHKGGDQPALPSSRKLKHFLVCKGVDANVISPLVGEMPGRAEGGI